MGSSGVIRPPTKKKHKRHAYEKKRPRSAPPRTKRLRRKDHRAKGAGATPSPSKDRFTHLDPPLQTGHVSGVNPYDGF